MLCSHGAVLDGERDVLNIDGRASSWVVSWSHCTNLELLSWGSPERRQQEIMYVSLSL